MPEFDEKSQIVIACNNIFTDEQRIYRKTPYCAALEQQLNARNVVVAQATELHNKVLDMVKYSSTVYYELANMCIPNEKFYFYAHGVLVDKWVGFNT